MRIGTSTGLSLVLLSLGGMSLGGMTLAGSSGCVDKGPSGAKIDPAYIKANVLREAPAGIDTSAKADLGGKVLYLGNEVQTKVLSPGGQGVVVHYWKVVEPPGSDFKIFSHLNGNGAEWINLDRTDMRQGYPAKDWKAGDVIRDEQKFSLPKTWKSKRATLSVGIYRQGGQGTDARMEIVTGARDAERRVPAARFEVEVDTAILGSKDTEYFVRKVDSPMVIDGRADEIAWKSAPMSPNFSDAEGGPKLGQRTVARLLWSDTHLYAFVQVGDRDVYSEYKNHDDPLWKQDVIEFFIDADRNRRGYVELQVNPNNAHFDAWFPKTRASKHYFDWNSKMQSAVVIHGTSDDRSDRDQGWDLELAIPLEDVKGMDKDMAVRLPPQIGDQWRMNVIRGEKPKNAGLAAASWNPIPISDFHALDRMFTLVFADSEGKRERGASSSESGNASSGEAAPEAVAKPVEGASMQPVPKPAPTSGKTLVVPARLQAQPVEPAGAEP